jgi:hypothetical protein
MSRSFLTVLTSVAFVSTLPGCLASTYKTGLPGGGEKHEDSASYFVWGMIGDKSIDLTKVCPNGVAQWKDYLTFGDFLITCIACGGLIYGKRTIEIECAGPPGPTTVPTKGNGPGTGTGTAAPPPRPTSFLLVPDEAHHQTRVIPMPTECKLPAGHI